MLKIITTLTLFLIGILAKGQEVETRTVSSFSKVKVQHGIELICIEGEIPSIRIEANNSSIFDKISTTVRGNTLTVDSKNCKETEIKNSALRVYVVSKEWNTLEANCNAKITIEESINPINLKIVLKSGASLSGTVKACSEVKLLASENTIFNGKIECLRLEGTFSNNAKVNLTGKAEKTSFESTHDVLLSARNFVSKSITVSAHGKSIAALYAHSKLIVDVADEARVTYTGFPDNIALNEEATSLHIYRCDQSISLN